MSNRNWRGQAFTSLCSLVSFILLSITAIILYIEPHGRVAYWIKWNFLGLEKDQWGNIHLFAGLLFLVAGGFHLYYNWKPLLRYLSAKIETGLRYKRELTISSLIFLWITASGVWGLPPLVYLADLSEAIKGAWVTSAELEPPFGHAEQVSLKTFCKKQGIPLDRAMAVLREAGFKVNNPDATLGDIADSQGTSGMAVYAVIQKLEKKPKTMKLGSVWTPGMVEETFAGTGVGRKSIAQIIKGHGLDPKTVYHRLKVGGIEAKDDDKIKDVARKHDSTPIKILIIMLVDKI
ncbi:MAG: DUF4405 domain-containing protein [Desulfobacterales bacterium]|jgi:hypothetical protein